MIDVCIRVTGDVVLEVYTVEQGRHEDVHSEGIQIEGTGVIDTSGNNERALDLTLVGFVTTALASNVEKDGRH